MGKQNVPTAAELKAAFGPLKKAVAKLAMDNDWSVPQASLAMAMVLGSHINFANMCKELPAPLDVYTAMCVDVVQRMAVDGDEADVKFTLH